MAFRRPAESASVGVPSMSKRRFLALVPEDYSRKTLFWATLALLVNVAFAIFNAVLAVVNRSVWYAALAGYYTALILLRGGIVLAARRLNKRTYAASGRAEAEWKIYIASGAVLFAFELAMVIAVTEMIIGDRPVQGGEISAITTAAYTFYKAVMAIIHLVRARRHGGPVAQALRTVNIADACISMVSLTVLLIATFGDGAGMIAMKASVGFGAVAVTAAMAAGILVSGIRSLRRVRAAESTAADGEAEGFR